MKYKGHWNTESNYNVKGIMAMNYLWYFEILKHEAVQTLSVLKAEFCYPYPITLTTITHYTLLGSMNLL